MTSRDRILAAIKREKPDRVPKNMRCCPEIIELFKKKTGMESMDDYFGYDMRFVQYTPGEHKEDFSKHINISDIPEGGFLSEWGAIWTKANFTCRHPMCNFTSISQIDEYPFPDFDSDYRYRNLSEDTQKIKNKELAVFSFYECGCFEQACALRGMDKFFMDLIENEKFVDALLQKILKRKIENAKRYTAANVDVVWIGDDMGSQKSMLMSPDMWRQYFKPCLVKIIKEVGKVNPNVYIAYHSCGYIEPIIPELIEAGVDILESVQPEAMNPAKLKNEFGDRLSFWGTVGAQSTMACGTPQEVKKVVKERIETIGRGGGLIIAPAHTMEKEVPYENIIAFFEAVEEYGEY